MRRELVSGANYILACNLSYCNPVFTGMWWGQALHCTFRSGAKTPGSQGSGD